MRRLLACTVGLLLLASCTDGSDPSRLEDQSAEEGGLPPSGNFEIFDGTSGSAGANPNFFFLPPLVPTTPAYAGVPDLDQNPTVTVCRFDSWDSTEETCGSALAVFTTEADQFGNQIVVGPGGKYRVRWDTDQYGVEDRERFRVSVSLGLKAVGWVDVKAYGRNINSHLDQQGNIVLSTTGELNITFRIEEGVLEHEYCDVSGIEDCDVEIFQYDEAGCLRVFENPGQTGELLGSQACLPASAATLNGNPVAGEYAVILTLEDAANQGGAVPTNLQVPFFPDLTTDPPGIVFDPNSSGVGVVICQAVEADGGIPEVLHPQLRPFVVYSDGTTGLPEEFSYGAPECEGYGQHAHSGSTEGYSKGLFERVAAGVTAGVTKASRFFLPKPLKAWRLHGGLNTTVYNTSGNDGDGGEEEPEQAPGIVPAGETFVVELGALLDVSPVSSNAGVPSTGRVGTESFITVNALNALDEPFPFEVPVSVSVTSGTESVDLEVLYVGSGQYTASYTPATVGTDVVTVTIDGVEISDSPYTSEIAPRLADAAGTTFEVSYSEVGDPTTVTVSVVDGEGNPYTYGVAYPIDVEISVTGANTASATAADPDGDGTYVASYTPTEFGDDVITVTVNGESTGDSPFTKTTAPRPVDPSQSSATVSSAANVPAGGQVGFETTVTILAANEIGEAYDYPAIRPIDVQVAVSGDNTVPAFSVTDEDSDGTYTAAYTPTFEGTDLIAVTIDGQAINGSPFSFAVAPENGDLLVDVAILGGAPEDGLPVILYDSSGNPVGQGPETTDANGLATFSGVPFGTYTVHLPKRDFDVEFSGSTVDVDYRTDGQTVTLTGQTLALPGGVSVWRVRDGGTGNAYHYVVGGRSWNSAENQVQSDVLLGVQGHLVDILSQAENDFVQGFFLNDPNLCPNVTNPKHCKLRGWLGLSDSEAEGTFVWTTGEPASFFNWGRGQPDDSKSNFDHAEIGAEGLWSVVNGASSNNEGYFVEWDVVWPNTPPF